MSNAPHISRREWIHWQEPGGYPHEPTDTIVVTSAANRYVDIRLYQLIPKENEPVQVAGVTPTARISWAFAGTSSSTFQIDPRDGVVKTHSQWFHWIDSHSLEPEKIIDQGVMVPTIKGKTIESGFMPHPDTGVMTPYNECWITVTPLVTNKGKGKESETSGYWNVALVVQGDEKKIRGMVIRVGHICQGIIRRGEESVSIEKWCWFPGGGWQRLTRIGDEWMPCGVAMEAEKLDLNGTVNFEGVEWKVRELKQF